MSHFPWNRPEQQKQSHDTATHHWRPGIVALAAAMALSACNDKDSPIKADSTAPTPAPAATPEAAQLQPAAYVPPSADVLYQMVAPIALYPDKLVAQILAGSTYPDQIGAAETWLGQNPGLQKTALANAVNAQNWDPSVKSLTQFPNVLEQMASNLPWTTALGKAYYNDPSDVMNAIQVMRSRAYKAGTLKTSKQLKVNVASTPSAVAYTPGAVVTPLPDPVIAPPEQFIEIAPSQVDTVYVPQYDPGVVYGEPLPVYGGYRYVEVPPPAPVVGVPVVAGLLGFGVGVVLAESMDRHPSWGWNSWDMHWGDHDRPWRYGDRPPPPQARPAVVYNNTTYISQSHTVVQNIRRTDNTYVNNVYQNGAVPAPTQAALPMQQQSAGAFVPQHGLQPGTLAAGAAGAAVGAAALAAGSHAWNQKQQQTPLAAVPQGRPGFGQGQPPATPAMPHAPNGNAFMQLRDQRSQDHSAGPGRQPQAPLMQASMAEKAQQQMQQQRTQEQARRQQQMQQQAQAREPQQRQPAQMQQAQQQRAQEQAQRQQQMQQQAQAQAREQQQRQQQAQMQQAQQQRTQEQAQRQQQMQQQAQAREQQQRQQQAQMQQAQQQRAQEQAQRQQQMQQQAQAREQQQRQQQAQMQQMQQQRAQEQAMRQQQMQQQRAQEQAQRQAEQPPHMQAARAEARAHGDHDKR